MEHDPSGRADATGRGGPRRDAVGHRRGRPSTDERPATRSPSSSSAYLVRTRRRGATVAARSGVLEAEVLRPGRPGIVDVVARVGERTVHVPLRPARARGTRSEFLPDGEDPVLGVVRGRRRPGRGLRRPARRRGGRRLLLERVTGEEVDPALVRQIRHDGGVGHPGHGGPPRLHRLHRGGRRAPARARAAPRPRRGRLQPPAPPRLAVWRRGGRDLGVVQEFLAGASSGWALAAHLGARPVRLGRAPRAGRRRLRGRGPPARHHGGPDALGLDQAFGRRAGTSGPGPTPSRRRCDRVAPHLLDRPDVEELLDELRALDGPVARPSGPTATSTWAGWPDRAGLVRRSTSPPGGRPGVAWPAPCEPDGPTAARPVYRSPLADVADMLWSLEHVADDGRRRARPDGPRRPRASWPTPGRRATAGLPRRLPGGARDQRPRPARPRGGAHPRRRLRARAGGARRADSGPARATTRA